MPPEATVVVCTQGREPLLQRTLEALLAQRGVDVEVLVVAECTASELRERAPASAGVRVVHEPDSSLNRKRNRAVAEAESDRVLFTDDDCVPDPDWARCLAAALDEHPVATGRVLPLNDGGRVSTRTGSAPRVFAGAFDRLLAWRAGCGNNMAVRRSALAVLGGFRDDLGVGTWSGAACDTELFFRAMARGAGGVRYEPDAVVRHRQPEDESDVLRKRRGYYRGLSYMARCVHPRSPAAWAMAAGRLAGSAALWGAAVVTLRGPAVRRHWAELKGAVEGLHPPVTAAAPGAQRRLA